MWKWIYQFGFMTFCANGHGEECAMVILAPEGCEDMPVQEWIVPGTYTEFDYADAR